ncbi:MAG: thioredoxin domain-containing protein [bacterium]|nr:thioredoxin domain-containing protein [bacterium]
MVRSLAIILFLLSSSAIGQTAATIATATGRTFTSADLSPEARSEFTEQKKALENTRTQLLGQMIAEELLDREAKAAGSTREKLLAAQRARVTGPTAAQIQAVYDQNQSALGGRPLSDVRNEIVSFLRRDPEQKAIEDYIAALQAKYKYAVGKSINSPDLKPLDIVAALNGKQISAQDFETRNRLALNEYEHHSYEQIRADLEISILNALIAEEAKAKNVEPREIIAAEVTDKLRDFSDEEREKLESALMDRLFAKYEVKILLKEPPVIAQSISVAVEPSIGPANALATIVMFSDYQCPACARTHPVLKRVMAEFPGRVRLVVRDYPLENIHTNAFNAALAANAAAKQGKFTEYAEKLYTNQDSLDNASLVKFATELGLNAKQFEIDFTDPANAAEVKQDQADGESHGVNSTPTVFVNGVKVHSISASAFRRAIERALAK